MSSLLIYSASAGSGKTYTLTRKYLEVLLEHPNNYRRILAVTFTNKAAAEMKERVLKELVQLRDRPEKSNHLELLAAHLNITTEQVAERAKESLDHLLNDYSRMAIGTIDSFFQILLRSFARETGISSGFTLELDADLVVSQVVDELIQESGTRPAWRLWLQNWIEYRMDQGEGWSRLHADLVKMGKELLREEILVYALDQDAGMSDPGQVEKVINQSAVICKSFEDQLIGFAVATSGILNRYGLEVEDFKGRKGSPIGKMVRLNPDSFEPTDTFVKWEEQVDEWVTKSTPSDRRTSILRVVEQDLQPLLQKYLKFYRSESTDYHSAKVVRKNIYAFGLAVGFFELLNKYGKENEIFLIALTNPFLKRIINENPAPFLYEKSGNHYKHFLIDEFQDTSSQQWENLIPLVSNSLSENGLGMVVGDVKQSIYRWRNSNWRLLSSQAGNDMAAFGATTIALTRNFRSYRHIINFNNELFGRLPDVLKSTLNPGDYTTTSKDLPHHPDWLSTAYADYQQTSGTFKEGGIVQLEFIGVDQDEFDFYEEASSRLISIIEDLQQNQRYAPNDISILVRRKKDAVILSGFITEYLRQSNGKENVSYHLTSPDTYTLDSSPAIILLISFLQYINQPDEIYYEGTFDLEYALHILGDIPPKFSGPDDLTGALKKEGVAWKTLSLSKIVNRSVKALKLDQNHENLPFILAFLDLLVVVELNKGGHLQGLLDWWNETGFSKTVVMDIDPSSMQIYTIHKAKGLQFPVVIIPFTNWTIEQAGLNRSLLWVPTLDTRFNQVPVIPVPYSSALKETCFKNYYLREKLEQMLDALNLLYVGTTRPMEQLFLICPPADPRKRRISDYLFPLFEDRLNVEHRYTLGEKESCTHVRIPESRESIPLVIDRLITPDDDFELRTGHLVDTMAISAGLLMHQILEKMVQPDDFRRLLRRELEERKISQKEYNSNLVILEKVCLLPLVREWFSEEWEVKAEAELLVPGGGIKRPDRIMIRGDKAVVVDYKTGKAMESHKHQVLEYCKLLSEMGFGPVHGYLLYLPDAVVVQVN